MGIPAKVVPTINVLSKNITCIINIIFAAEKKSLYIAWASFHNDILNVIDLTHEPHREKTGFLPMRKQRRRSASR